MTSQPPDPYGQPSQHDPYGEGTPPPPPGQPGYPPPGQPGYPPPGQGYPPPQPQPATNTMAILSLVLAFVFAPVGAVLGHIARKQIRERGGQGEGIALAGIIIGWALTGLYLLSCCGFIILAVAAENANV